MKVTAYGLSLRAGNIHVTLDHVFEHLRIISGKMQTIQGADRMIYIDVDSDPDFVRGLLVTVKDQSKFCEWIRQRGGDFTIKVKNLDEQSKVMEFNFFLVNRKNGLGIYQYYYHSCALTTFQKYLRRIYRNLSNEARDVKLKAQGASIGKRTEKKIRAEYREGLHAATLFRNDTLEQYLKRYKQIKGLSYEVAALYVNEGPAQPLSGYISRRRETVFLDTKITAAKIVSAIKNMLPGTKQNSLKVSVMDDDDETQSVRISDIPNKYDIREYDDIAAGMDSLNVSEFYKHPLLLELRKVCTVTHKATFMAKVLDD